MVQVDVAKEKNTFVLRRYNLRALVLYAKVKEDRLRKLEDALVLIKLIRENDLLRSVKDWNRQGEYMPK